MELKEGLSIVAKLILDSIGEEKVEPTTQMGQELFNFVKKELSSKPKETSIISPEIDRKIRLLKQVEGEGGIFWIDSYSWKLLPHSFQTDFIALLDPLVIWQGVFALRVKLGPHESNLWSQLPYDLSVYELRDLSSYHITILGITNKSYYDRMSTQDFEKKKRHFESQCVRAIGNTAQGVIIKMKTKDSCG